MRHVPLIFFISALLLFLHSLAPPQTTRHRWRPYRQVSEWERYSNISLGPPAMYPLLPTGCLPTGEDVKHLKERLQSSQSYKSSAASHWSCWFTPSRHVPVALQTPWQAINQVLQPDLTGTCYLAHLPWDHLPWHNSPVGNVGLQSSMCVSYKCSTFIDPDLIITT